MAGRKIGAAGTARLAVLFQPPRIDRYLLFFGFLRGLGGSERAVPALPLLLVSGPPGSRYPLTQKIIMSGSIGTMWADEDHMSNRFGVSAGQSAASGYSQHDTESGIKSVGFSVGATYLLTDRWNANLTFRGDRLLSDAADSPVVKDDFVPAVFLTTSYKF